MASTSVPEQSSIVLLTTKLAIPPLQPRLVPSRRLLERLQHGGQSRLTLISAPAGFGKTTLVCQWIQHHKMPAAWYSLDESDNEPSVFYRYLLTALQNLDPSLKSALDPLLQGRTVVGKDIMTTIMNVLSQLSGPFHLILDDFQSVESSSLHRDITYLLRRSPPHLHVTVITRHDFPFQLSRLRVTQELTELKASDLQFTVDEAGDFFHDTMQLDLPQEQVRELHSLTEGWIVGLQVTGLSLQKGSADPKRLTAESILQNKYTLDYLFEEVFQHEPTEVQEFLLKTSILKQLTTDLCSHMTDVEYSFNMLEKLEHRNLFIMSLDDNRHWYRYHPLFAQMLRRRLLAAGDWSVADLHKKAARWYAEHGYVEEAFQHAFNSNDFEFAAGLVEERVVALIDNYEWAIARRWLEGLPDSVLRQRFLLLLYHALVVFLQEELVNIDAVIADLERVFDDLTRSYPAEKRKHAEDLLLALKINCLHYNREPAGVIPVAEGALQTISTRNVMALGLVQAVLSTAYIEQGDLLPAMDVVRAGLNALTHSSSGAGNYARAHLLNKQARLEFLCGHLKAAEGLLVDALEYSRRQDPLLRSAMAMFAITYAQILYSKNELDEALDHATRCVEYAEPVSDIGYLLLGLRMQAFVNESFGNSGLAGEIMNDALRRARQTKSPVRIAATELAAVQLASMQSELDTVARWASQRDLSGIQPFSRNFEKECLLMARFHMAAHDYRQAAELLDALRPRVSRRERLTSLLSIDVLRAACLSALDQEAEALDTLGSCLEFAGPEGYVRPFVESADHLVDMLYSLSKSSKGVVRIHASRLLKTCELELTSESTVRPLTAGDSETLSRREIEVLRLVFSGMTNREIAERSFISLNTVKTHIRKIYGKLGVTTREQAVLKAREFNYM